MNRITTKKQLAITLSKLEQLENPLAAFEQYSTNSEIAATILWNYGITGEFNDKVIADLGAGTGILGIGCLLLGAKKIYFVESDEAALNICKKNYKTLKSEFELGKAVFFLGKIQEFNNYCDIVIQNPPFGTKKKHADKNFLKKAFSLAPIIYTFHKASTDEFIRKIVSSNNYCITNEWLFKFPIKKTQVFHKKPVKKILVKVYRLTRY